MNHWSRCCWPRSSGASSLDRASNPLISSASDGVDGELPGALWSFEADIAEVGADVVDPVQGMTLPNSLSSKS